MNLVFQYAMRTVLGVALAAILMADSSSPTLGVGYASGYDVSWPQCGLRLPHPAAFAIVGLNNGSPGTGNPCFQREFRWAMRSNQGRSSIGLYVNSSNPGTLRGPAWPRSNRDRVSGTRSPNPFGACNGWNTRACSWQFGWNMAERDVHRLHLVRVRGYTWWLDVETMNHWERDRQNNRAVLAGMTDFLVQKGVTVGIYCSHYQWRVIAGTVSSRSVLYRLPEWITGASTSKGAKANCWGAPLTGGGTIQLSQWFTRRSKVDGDVLCPSFPLDPLRPISG